MNEIFSVQDEIAASVAEALKLTLFESSNRKPEYKPKPEAYNAVLQGRYLLSRAHTEDFEKIRNFFQRALEIDPDYPAAWLGLTDYNLAVQGFVPIKDAGERCCPTICRKSHTVETAISTGAHLSGLYQNGSRFGLVSRQELFSARSVHKS